MNIQEQIARLEQSRARLWSDLRKGGWEADEADLEIDLVEEHLALLRQMAEEESEEESEEEC